MATATATRVLGAMRGAAPSLGRRVAPLPLLRPGAPIRNRPRGSASLRRACIAAPGPATSRQDRPDRGRSNRCKAAASSTDVAPEAKRPASWELAAVAMGLAMHLGNMQRAVMSLVAIPLQKELALSMTDMGVLQSAFLWGYLACQFPAGVLSDKYGGIRVLLICLALWSAASVFTPLAQHSAAPVLVLCAARAVAGAAQAAVVPAAGSAAAALVPEESRGNVLSGVFAAFNMGTVASLMVTPLIVSRYGWTGAFYALGGLGLVSAAAMLAALPPAVLESPPPPPTAAGPGGGGWRSLTPQKWLDVAVLCWAHGVIGWGFFILQSWVPTFMHEELGFQSLRSAGLLSSVPWVAMAAVTVASGRLADWLVRSGRGSREAVACRMQAVGTLGPAIGVASLLVVPSWQAAVASLTLALGLSGFTYPGFHTYVQLACGKKAGALLGVTNSLGISLGIVGNLVTGKVVEATGGFAGVWCLMCALYVSSWLAWSARLRGDRIFGDDMFA